MSPEEITARRWRDASRATGKDRPDIALAYLEEALEADPFCQEVLVFAGDLWVMHAEKLGVSVEEGEWRALSYYDRAIAAHPEHAEAYAEKCCVLLYQERYEEALACAERGFELLDRPPTTDLCPGVWTNVAESLYRRKAEALLELGRDDEGRRVLDDGLRRIPGSKYLTSAVEYFLPDVDDPEGEEGE